jgi:flagellar motor switch protein FliN
MTQLSAEIASEVLAACQANAAEAGAALSRALDATIALSPGEPATLNMAALPDGLEDPGLAIVFRVGEQSALALLSESSGLTPEWCAAPDATGESKLASLAQELSVLLFPESIAVDSFGAVYVNDLAAAMQKAEIATGAEMLPLALSDDSNQGTLHFIWPASDAAALLPEPAKDLAPVASPPPAERSEPTDPLDRLPAYSRSMLRIEVPVVVNLASTKQTIEEVLELGPGSIIKFDKSCEELLDLEVDGHPIARGDAVKVGDKFGLRINSMILPEERFRKLCREERKA